jgi:hypothetical protein
MSFVSVAVGIVGEGLAANIMAGAMMGGSVKAATNVASGKNVFNDIGRGIVMGGLTGGIAPEVSSMFNIGMPAAAGITQGGLTALSTGDMSKGLMAGIGAYGMYGLSESVANAGGNSLTGTNLADYDAKLIEAGYTPGTAEYGEAASKMALNAKEAAFNAPISNKMSAGFDAIKNDPGAFAKNNWKAMAAAALPVLSDIDTTTSMPGVSQVPGKIRRFNYDPYGQSYASAGTYEAPGTAANGGLMGMANGGVARYAGGGFTPEQVASYIQNNKLDAAGQAAAQKAFGVSDDIFNQGLALLQPGANQAGVQAATNAYYQSASPQQDVANRAFAQQQGLTTAAAPVLAPAATNQAAAGNTTASTALNNAGSIGGDALIAITAPPQSGGLNTLAANQAATGSTTAANALGNAGVPTTAAADQQALAIQAVQSGISAGKTPAQIAAEVNTKYGKNFTAQNVSDFAVANAPALNAAGISNAALYAETNRDFKGVAGGTGLAGLNANIVAAMANTATAKPNATAAEIKSILAGYGADSSDFKRAMGMTPEEWDATHSSIINQPPNSTIIGGGGNDSITGGTNNDSITGGTNNDSITGGTGNDLGVITETGKVLPVVTLSDGTKLVVNTTQVATTGVTAPTVLNEASRTALPVGVGGNQTATINPNGTVSMNTGTPNMPVGGYTGMQSLRDAYTKGGGSLGYVPVAPKTMAEFNQKYNTLTGGSKQAYDYLMGGEYSPTPYTKTGEVMKPYSEAVLGIPGDVSKKRYLFDPATRSYKINPDYVPITYDSKGNKLTGVSNKDVASYVNSNKDAATSDYQKWMTDNNVSLEQLAGALGISLAEAKKRFGTGTTTDTTSTAGVAFDAAGNRVDELGRIIKGPVTIASGGLASMAGGGMSAQYDLGSYSDGGRLLRGPGDGVSDSIPATIGKGRPARLADGEFVVPARIVSEIGNGSTEAGARKLYAMMDRVQAARRKSIGRGKVAKNTRADKYLPA